MDDQHQPKIPGSWQREAPRPYFATGVMINGRQRRYVAIGYTDQHGPLCCYQVEWLAGDVHHQLIYLYTGADRYQLWRHYYSALAAAEEQDYLLPKSLDRPRVSDVKNIAAELQPED